MQQTLGENVDGELHMVRRSSKTIREKDVIAEFTKRRKRLTKRAIVLGIIIAGVVIFREQGALSKTNTIALLGLAFLFAVVAGVKLWRCPSCNWFP